MHSLFRFAALRHPEHADLIAHVLAIPPKRKDRAVVAFLNDAEVEALLASPDRSSWIGRRDHLIFTVAIDTGLRVSELVGLTGKDAHLQGPGPAHLRCVGKGRKERVTPLLQATAALLRCWVREQRTGPDDPLFQTSTGHRLSPDAVQRRLEKYLTTARQTSMPLP